jgi:alginate O-acetyltransferase complex protein AlgJ
MSDTETPHVTRRQHITREEEADRCLNHTSYSKGSQILTVLLFLAVVFGVPVAQHYVEIKRNLAKRAEWNPSSGTPKPGLAPQIYDVFKLLPTGEQISKAQGFWGYWNLFPTVDSINAFETSLKENSVLTTSLLSPTQLAMTSLLGAGNEKAYVGKDNWLFYRPDVEYLTTPGFLDPSRLKDRSHGATEIQPDPVKAILDFKSQLASRGITLVVMPMSTKPMIHPEMLAGPGAEGKILQNESFDKFKTELESNGVHVFDPTPALLDLKAKSPEKLYLQTDTHWTPDAMHEVSLKLGDFLFNLCGLPRVAQNSLTLSPKIISNLGDIAEMLKLPSDQKLFTKQTVTISQVQNTNGSPWKADRQSEVLLLGDSFSNIYSLDGMGWGTSAGFAEHLSYAIGRPIDKIVINAGGAFASRRDLAGQMARGIDHLANKKVVVYEFSMRDLAQGDWKMIKLPPAPKKIEVAPPVVKTNPVIAKPLSAFKPIVVKPDILDLGKHEKVEISIPVPAGTWALKVISPDGNSVQGLTSGSSAADTTLISHWDGLDVRHKPVAVGTYTLQVEGTRPDKSALEPVSFKLAVFDSTAKGAIKPPAPIQSQVKPAITPSKTPTISTSHPKQPGTTATTPVKPAEEGLIVTGRIASRPDTPKPGSVPYKDCLIALQLTDLKAVGGTVKGPNIVVYVWGMRDNKLVDGAYSVGQTIRFKLVPWASVDSKYGGYNRQELASDDALSWEAFWGEIK